MLSHSPKSGRLLVRQTPNHCAALVGVLHFPAEFAIAECAAYLMVMHEGRIVVATDRLDEGLPDHLKGSGISGLLRAEAWYRCRTPSAMTVRFLQAFPESNGWIVAAALAQEPPNVEFDSTGHAWFDVTVGALRELSPPVDMRGLSIGQALTQNPVWPDGEGRPHSVPQIESLARQAYLRFNTLLARHGAGELSETQVREAFDLDTDLISHIGYYRIDKPYCKYLAGLAALGLLKLDAPLTAEEFEEREAEVGGFTRSITIDSRCAQLRELAVELGID